MDAYDKICDIEKRSKVAISAMRAVHARLTSMSDRSTPEYARLYKEFKAHRHTIDGLAAEAKAVEASTDPRRASPGFWSRLFGA